LQKAAIWVLDILLAAIICMIVLLAAARAIEILDAEETADAGAVNLTKVETCK